MPKLNQIVAIVSGKKSETEKARKAIYKIAQKSDLFNGHVRKYSPNDEDGDQLPDESKRVQQNVPGLIRAFRDAISDLWDCVATQDTSNSLAKADIILDNGTVLVEGVPVTTLLWLDKQLTDLRTFVSHLPVLDPSYDWTWDQNSLCYKTMPTITTRTQKQPKPVVKYDATEHHPAQTELFTQDVIIGRWSTLQFSGAIPLETKKKYEDAVSRLIVSVRKAREQANSIDAVERKISAALLDYVFETE